MRQIELKTLNKKISSYNATDVKKGRIQYNEEFGCYNYNELTLDEVLNFLKTEGMSCFYCGRETTLDYPHNYYPKQFTLDRVQNKLPHIITNLKVCCYTCNVLRSDSMTSQKFKDIFQSKH